MLIGIGSRFQHIFKPQAEDGGYVLDNPDDDGDWDMAM